MKNRLITVLIGAIVIGMAFGAPYNAPSVSAQSSTTGSGVTITRDLAVGMSGSDVTALQLFLENKGYLVVPPGIARGYFGALTQAAVMKFQVASGLTPTGTFNAQTRAAYNSHRGGVSGGGSGGGTVSSGSSNLTCPGGFNLTSYNGQFICLKRVDTPSNGGSTGGSSGSGSGSSSGDLRGGEATLDNFEVSEGDDDSPEEDESGAEIMEIEFDVEDGDIRIERVDVHFEFTGSSDGEDEPWEVFEQAYLLIDGDEVADIETNDDRDWDEEDDDVYRLRFEGINYIVREGDTVKMTLEVDVSSDIDGAEDGDVSFELYIPDDGVRAKDGENRNEEIGDEDETATVNIEDEDSDDNNSDDADEDDAEDAIQDAQDAIDDARDEINDAEDDGDDVDDAEDLLDDAEDALDDAEDAFEDEDWDDAVDAAEDAIDLAEDAINAIED